MDMDTVLSAQLRPAFHTLAVYKWPGMVFKALWAMLHLTDNQSK